MQIKPWEAALHQRGSTVKSPAVPPASIHRESTERTETPTPAISQLMETESYDHTARASTPGFDGTYVFIQANRSEAVCECPSALLGTHRSWPNTRSSISTQDLRIQLCFFLLQY